MRPGAPGPVEAFKQHGEDFVVADTLAELVAGMNGSPTSRGSTSTRSSAQVVGARPRARQRLHQGRCRSRRSAAPARYRGDKLIRVAKPHRLLDPKAGPLIAVRLNILTRKTLGGLETDLDGRVPAAPTASRCPACTPRARSAGFGGGGMHGYNALEGTFLGGCLFSGRTAGRAVAAAL